MGIEYLGEVLKGRSKAILQNYWSCFVAFMQNIVGKF